MSCLPAICFRSACGAVFPTLPPRGKKAWGQTFVSLSHLSHDGSVACRDGIEEPESGRKCSVLSRWLSVRSKVESADRGYSGRCGVRSEETGLLAVGLAAVRHTNYVNHGLVVINGVDDAVVADSNAPKLTSAFELLRPVCARVGAESENRGVDPMSWRRRAGWRAPSRPAANGELQLRADLSAHGLLRQPLVVGALLGKKLIVDIFPYLTRDARDR